MSAQPKLYRTPRDPGGFPFGYNWRATATGFALLVAFNFLATQFVAAQFRYQPALGSPLLRTRSAALYQPFAWCIWGYRNCTSRDQRVRKPLFEGEMIVLGGCVLSMIGFFAAANRRALRLSENAEDLHGSALWARSEDIEATGLMKAMVASMWAAGTTTPPAVSGNQVLASNALALLARLFRYGSIDHVGAFINFATGQMVPVPVA